MSFLQTNISVIILTVVGIISIHGYSKVKDRERELGNKNLRNLFEFQANQIIWW